MVYLCIRRGLTKWGKGSPDKEEQKGSKAGKEYKMNQKVRRARGQAARGMG